MSSPPSCLRLRRVAGHLLAAPVASQQQQVIIDSLPDGPLQAANFRVRDAATPEAAEGEVLVQTLALTIAAGQRAGLQGSASYAGAPRAGVVMGGTGVGRVLASRCADFDVGDLVMGATGWQEVAALPGQAVTKFAAGADPALLLGALGTNGLTAYFGLREVGAPQPGDTVVVSAAGGSVGHLVGQMAKIWGCRVVGVAGSEEKCRSLLGDLGFDAAVNYKSPTFRDDFKAATPERIDVYFDNTGGDILSAALFRMKRRGRVVCCGNISGYDTSQPGNGPRGVPGLLVNNEVRMEGFLVFSYADRYAEARAEISEWVRSGQLRPRTTVYNGLGKAPQAFVDLLQGATNGTTVVRVAT